jgi:TRAP-type C4-dicarboxylate transport system permease small subunit
MRAALDKLFTLAGWLSGVFMVGTLLAVLLGIVARAVAFDIPGTDAYAGYSMAAGAFLALAYTLRRGEHIRVTLIVGRLEGAARRALELFCHAVAVLLSGALGWYSVRLVWQSYEMHDVSQGLDATPLWIPQIAMAVGAVLFFVAFVSDFVAVLRGEAVAEEREGGEPAHVE